MEYRFSERQVRSLIRIAFTEKERHPGKSETEILNHVMDIAEFVVRIIGEEEE